MKDAPQFSTRTILSFSQVELALLSLCAQALAYWVRVGHWPRLIEHDADRGWSVW